MQKRTITAIINDLKKNTLDLVASFQVNNPDAEGLPLGVFIATRNLLYSLYDPETADRFNELISPNNNSGLCSVKFSDIDNFREFYDTLSEA